MQGFNARVHFVVVFCDGGVRIIDSLLSKGVFERRTSTGSGLFTFLCRVVLPTFSSKLSP